MVGGFVEGVWEEVGEEVGGGSAHSAVQSVGIKAFVKLQWKKICITCIHVTYIYAF